MAEERDDRKLSGGSSAAPAPRVRGASRPAGGIRRRLLRSHRRVWFIGIGLLVVGLASTLWLRASRADLATLREPTVRSVTQALGGVQRSLAALRGWVIVGNPAFKRERAAAWSDEIDPALQTLDELAGRWARPEDRRRLAEATSALGRLRDWQWWIEDVAHIPGNEPAHVIYLQNVLPIADRVRNGVTDMLRLERLRPPRTERLALHGAMEELRFAFAECQVDLVDFISRGDVMYEDRFRESLGVASGRLLEIQARRSQLTASQRELLAWIVPELGVYEPYARQAMGVRKTARWNLARYWLEEEADPLTQTVTGLLSELSASQTQEMLRAGRLADRVSNLVLLVSLALVAVMAAAVQVLAGRGAEELTRPIEALAAGARELAAGRLAGDIPVTRDDELGELTAAFNRMRASLEQKESELRRARDAAGAVSARLSIAGELLTALAGAVSIDDLAEAVAARLKWAIHAESLLLYAGPTLSPTGQWAQRELLRREGGWNPVPASLAAQVAELAAAGGVVRATPDADGRPPPWLAGQSARELPPASGLAMGFGPDRGVLVVGVTDRTAAVSAEVGFARMLHSALAQSVERVLLVNELRRSNQTLRGARRALQKRFEEAGQLAAGVAHELNTPLTTLLGIIGSLRRQLLAATAGSAPQESSTREYLELMESEVGACERLTESLLDFGAVAAGEIAPCDLNAVANEAVALAASAQPASGERMSTQLADRPVPAQARRRQLMQVVRNVLRNALDATQEGGGSVRVGTEIEDETAVLWVEDEGSGIPPELLEKVFEPFFTTKADGHGLGLAVCRRLVEAMEGSLEASSDGPGAGARFVIRLQRAPERA